MRIVYVSMATIPSRSANSIHVMKMCEAMTQQGHQVVLVAQHSAVEPVGEMDDFQFYGVEPGFQVIRQKPAPGKISRYLYGLKTLGHIWLFKPDLVYGRFLLGCLLAARLTGARVILEVHAPINPNDVMEQRLFQWLIRSRRLQRLVVISAALKDYYVLTFRIPPERVQVAHDGANPLPADLKPLSLPNLTDSTPFHVGYIGHLYQGKGMELIAELAKQCPEATFHIVGGQPEDIDGWKNKLSDTSNVLFHGFYPHSEVARFALACDVLIAPYQEEVYGHGKVKKHRSLSSWMSPLKLFEYMAAGKPIICSDLPVLREIIQDHHNGLLCPHDQPTAWADALMQLKARPDLARRLGDQARTDFLAQYTWFERARRVIV